MKKEKELSRQTLQHRKKHWTLVLYDKKGKSYLVSPKHYMLNPDNDKSKKGS